MTKSTLYGIVYGGKIVKKGSAKEMRKLAKKHSGAFVVTTMRDVGEEWKPKPTGFEGLPIR